MYKVVYMSVWCFNTNESRAKYVFADVMYFKTMGQNQHKVKFTIVYMLKHDMSSNSQKVFIKPLV